MRDDKVRKTGPPGLITLALLAGGPALALAQSPGEPFARDPAEDFNTLALNNDPRGIWSDGTTMWVADGFDGKIYAYSLATKARDVGKDFDTLAAAGNGNPLGIWSDGTTMWVADWLDAKIYAYSMATKARDAGRDFDTLTAAGNGIPRASGPTGRPCGWRTRSTTRYTPTAW